MTDEERVTSESEVHPDVRDEAEPSTARENPAVSQVSGRTIVLWALCSIALLAFVALGSVPTYVWRFGRLYEEARPVLGIWTIEVNNLPQVSHQWVLNGAFYLALIVFLMGAIGGLWLLLGATENETTPAAGSAPDQESTVA